MLPTVVNARERHQKNGEFQSVHPLQWFQKNNQPLILLLINTPLHDPLPVESVHGPTYSLTNLCRDLKYS